MFLRFSCQERFKDEPSEDLRVAIGLERRTSWASGTFVRPDGLVATAYHALSKIADWKRRPVGGSSVVVGCESKDVTVDIFRIENISGAIRGEPGNFTETLNNRDPSLAYDDVLFLKAETRGARVPYLCAPAEIKLTDYDDLAITAAGVDNDEGLPQFVMRPGRSKATWGAGEASKYLLMEPSSVDGMSGGPVVRKDGALVGLVQGFPPLVQSNRHRESFHSAS